jgi:hypothetical protein
VQECVRACRAKCKCFVSCFVQTDCVRLCAIKELALCLDLILRKVDLVCCVQITCPVRSWLCGLCTGAEECKSLKTNKEEEEVGGCSPTLG